VPEIPSRGIPLEVLDALEPVQSGGFFDFEGQALPF
jgi:hypothetical protein